MYILLSPSKTFDLKGLSRMPVATAQPLGLKYIAPIAEAVLSIEDDALRKALSLNAKQLSEARQHWQSLVGGELEPRRAMELYSGMVFRKLGAKTLDSDAWAWADEHLGICSFVYGLLRPSDGIVPYRMEGTMRLGSGQSVFEYHRDRLTPLLIEAVKRSGGVLLYLASEEMKLLFHWAEVERAVRIVTPTFLVPQEDGTRKQITIYTKMARGTMARNIILGRLTELSQILELSPEGYQYEAGLSTEDELIFSL